MPSRRIRLCLKDLYHLDIVEMIERETRQFELWEIRDPDDSLFQSAYDALWHAFGEQGEMERIDVIRAFRKRLPQVTAYVACEYNLARMVDRALHGEHVVACFDSPGDSIGGPPYLHVRQDQREMGRRAVDLLMAQLRGEAVPNLSLVPFELVDAEGN